MEYDLPLFLQLYIHPVTYPSRSQIIVFKYMYLYNHYNVCLQNTIKNMYLEYDLI